tara:strand:+ start:3003 stop:3146 length:144 start_codon:yes stop_codon:yes gene_type:complete
VKDEYVKKALDVTVNKNPFIIVIIQINLVNKNNPLFKERLQNSFKKI